MAAQATAYLPIGKNRPWYQNRTILLLVGLLAINFASEIVHGIIVHRLGGVEDYGPMRVGEAVRGLLLGLMTLYVLTHLRSRVSRWVLLTGLGTVVLICLQSLLFNLGYGDIFRTVTRALRWLYLFFVFAFVVNEFPKAQIKPEAAVQILKVLVVVFYCLPIFTAALGIAGYRVYGEGSTRMGYGGFIMNSNVVAAVFVMLLPFYLRLRSYVDWILLGLFGGAGVLLGSKLVYLGFAAVIGAWLVLLVVRELIYGRPQVRRSTAFAGVLALLVISILPFTPLMDLLTQMLDSVVELFSYYMGGGGGYYSSFIDVLSSHRTLRMMNFIDWARRIENFSMLVFGGGAPNFARLYTEMDWVDLAALFGVVGMGFYYGSILYLLAQVVRRRGFALRWQVAAMLVLSLASSLTSGHTYDGPVIGIIIGYVLGVYFSQRPAVTTRPAARASSQ